MSDVFVCNETSQVLDTAPLTRAVRTTLRMHRDSGTPVGQVSIVITGDDQVRNLNRRHRGIDSVTDVLSFPALPHGIMQEDSVLGDLVLALPWASRQADLAGHKLMEDLVLLVVHGTLHLLGFSHEDNCRREAMWEAQAATLRRLGLSPEYAGQLEEVSQNEKCV